MSKKWLSLENQGLEIEKLWFINKDRAVNKHGSIRQHLSQNRRMLRIASIDQVIGESVYKDDFRREFGHIDKAVAVDLDERFAGWKLGIVESVAIKKAVVWELLDGVKVY